MAYPLFDPTIPPYPSRIDEDGIYLRYIKGLTISKSTVRLLHERGCVEVDNLPPWNLNGEIHPMYSRQNFKNVAEAEYEYLRPALVLATKFLTTDLMLEYFTHIQFGEYRMLQRKQGERTISEHRYIANSDKEHTSEALRRTKETLLEMSQGFDIIFFGPKVSELADLEGLAFRDTPDLKRFLDTVVGAYLEGLAFRDTPDLKRFLDTVVGAYFSNQAQNDTKEPTKETSHKGITGTNRVSDPNNADMEIVEVDIMAPTFLTKSKSSAKPCYPGICLNHRFLNYVREALHGHLWTPCQAQRLFFTLAATIVHEIAHCFWAFITRDNPSAEPSWLKRPDLTSHGELGYDWEGFALGSVSSVTNFGETKDPFTEFQMAIFVDSAGIDRAHSSMHYYALPLQYINAWFRKETWENIRKNGVVLGRPSLGGTVLLQALAPISDQRDLTLHVPLTLDYNTFLVLSTFFWLGLSLMS